MGHKIHAYSRPANTGAGAASSVDDGEATEDERAQSLLEDTVEFEVYHVCRLFVLHPLTLFILARMLGTIVYVEYSGLP